MKVWKILIVLAMAGATSMCASAGTTTVGFVGMEALRSGSEGLVTTNYTEGGYRFSPACHIDWLSHPQYGPAFVDNAGIGWDSSGCQTFNNKNYLGHPNSERLYIDSNGGLFDLVSIRAIGNEITSTGAMVYSSKGGALIIDIPSWDVGFATALFSGDAWTGVEWIEIQGGGGGPKWLMDSITFSSVPEPGAFALVLIAAAAARRAARRRSAND